MGQRALLRVALCIALLAPLPAPAAVPDWAAVAQVREVQVLTTNEDGSTRETVIWLAVLDGQGYIRTTPRTTWGDNVERNPDVVLRIEGTEYPLRASFVTDESLREEIIRTFRAKYGWTDGLLNIVRGRYPRIMRLDPRRETP